MISFTCKFNKNEKNHLYYINNYFFSICIFSEKFNN